MRGTAAGRPRVLARVLVLALGVAVRTGTGTGTGTGVVTCGSVVKLLNVRHNVRLHSHDVRYGSGSGQQSVTGVSAADDGNSYWRVAEVALDAECWLLRLVWLEKSLNSSPLLESLWHSLTLPRRDIGTSITPVHTAAIGTSVTSVPTTVTGTFMTLQDLQEGSTNTSKGPPPCAKDSAAERDSLLWHCP